MILSILKHWCPRMLRWEKEWRDRDRKFESFTRMADIEKYVKRRAGKEGD